MKNINDFINVIEPTKANLKIDISLYNMEAIHVTAYEFTDRFHILITPGEAKSVIIIFEARDSIEDITEDLKNFVNALIDHQVRLQLDKINGKIRDLIVTHAFSPIDLKKEIESL